MTLGVIGTAALVVLGLSLALSAGWLLVRRTAAQGELAEALERQAATSDILRVISSSPTDIQPVFDTIAESAARLCSAQFCFVFRFDGALIHFVAHHGVAPAGIAAVHRRWPAGPGRGSTTARAVLNGSIEQIADVHADADYELSNTADVANYRSTVAVPMLRDGRAIGAITVARSEAGLFPERQIELLKAFADQAVIAIENVRLFTEVQARNRDLNEALEQQTATSEILSEISKSPTDIQPVFDMIAQSAARLCEAQFCFVADYDGALVHFMAQHGMPPETVEALHRAYPMPPSRASIAGRAILSCTVEHIPDVEADPDYGLRRIADRTYRSMACVPILKDGRPVGAVVVGRAQVGQFSHRHVKLLETFADQAVIAIENVRLFKELEARTDDLSESLQQQTATADVLKVISRSTFDLKPVLDTLVESAVRLCEAYDAVILLREGEWLEVEAHYGPIPIDFAKWPVTRDWTSGRAVVDRTPIHVPDVAAAADEYPDSHAHSLRQGHRSILSVPLLRENEAIGVIAIRRNELRPFSDKQIELVTTFADQAVIAIENVRLFTELEARTDDLSESLQQQTATADVLKVISRSTFDLQPVLDTLVKSAVRLCEAYDSIILLRDGEYLQKGAHFGPIPFDFARWPITRSWTAGRAVVDRKPVHVPDLQTAGEEFPEGQSMALRLGHRTILSLPLLRGEEVIGTITIRRTEVRPFTDKQIDLLTTFADQAVIAIENVRLFDEVHARTRELTESLEQQTATSEILRAISMSPRDVQPVFETIVRNAVALCGSLFANVFRFDGELLHFVASHNVGPDYVELLQAKYPMRPDSSQVAGRVLLSRSVVRLEDALVDSDYDHRFPLAMGWRQMLGVPMLREGYPLGVIVVGWAEPGLVSKRQEDLLKTFADQAVIAIENVRLFDEVQTRNRDLSEALQQQTATADVLKVISRSTFDLQAVLDTLVESSIRLCGANDAAILLKEGDSLQFKAHQGPIPVDFEGWPISRSWVSGRAVVDRKPIHVHDLGTDEEYPDGRAMAQRMGFRTIVAVPLLRGQEALGALMIRRLEVNPFTDKQINLLTTFADQAVIAIENVRLFDEVQARTRELTEALEQQTATSEVLRIISSSPGELQPVFQAMLANATRICEANLGTMYYYQDSAFHLAAWLGASPALAELYSQRGSFRPLAGTPLDRLLRTKDVIHIADDAAELNPGAAARLGGARSTIAVPMLKDDELVGAIVIYRQEVRPFTHKQIELVTSFANQAVIAIENVRLLKELRERTTELAQSVEELRALGEVSQAVNSTLDLETVLNTIVAKAVQLSGTDAGSIYVLNKAHTKFKLRATYGMDEAMVAAIRDRRIRPGETAIGQATEQRQPVQIPDILNAPSARVLDVVVQAGFRAILIVPLLGPERAIGVLVIRRKAPGEFPQTTVDLLQTFASQSVVAILNARLFREIEEKSQQLEVASRHKSQFLANMSHELRTPLNAILGYSELIVDDIYGAVPDKARAALERVQSNGKHLLGLINDVLDLSKIEAGRLSLSLADYSINEVVASVAASVEGMAAEKQLALKLDVPPGLPIAHGDEQRIRQVLLNLVGNAIKFTDSGEVAIKACLSNGALRVSVSDTGPGISAEDQAKLFQDFQQADNSSTRKKGGTGLGLAISKRFIDLHGGRIWLQSTPGQGSTFSFELPVAMEHREDVA